MCYLCLDVGAEPLRRDCACRGTDAGFVHLSCLTDYAETKSKQASDDMREFAKPWQVCSGCHQCSQNDLAIDIATKFVPFVRRQYPGDTKRQVESLFVKLDALDTMFDVLQPVQKRKYGVTANVILSLIDRMKGDVSSLSRRYSQFKAHAHSAHGRVALSEGTEESAKRAVVHLKKALEVLEAIGNDDGIATTKIYIAIAKSMYEGGNNEEVLKASQELYEMRIAELGEENKFTIDSGVKYAVDLDTANRGGEARELLTKLLATSKQVLGPHHNKTKEVEKELKKVVDDANHN